MSNFYYYEDEDKDEEKDEDPELEAARCTYPSPGVTTMRLDAKLETVTVYRIFCPYCEDYLFDSQGGGSHWLLGDLRKRLQRDGGLFTCPGCGTDSLVPELPEGLLELLHPVPAAPTPVGSTEAKLTEESADAELPF